MDPLGISVCVCVLFQLGGLGFLADLYKDNSWSSLTVSSLVCVLFGPQQSEKQMEGEGERCDRKRGFFCRPSTSLEGKEPRETPSEPREMNLANVYFFVLLSLSSE